MSSVNFQYNREGWRVLLCPKAILRQLVEPHWNTTYCTNPNTNLQKLLNECDNFKLFLEIKKKNTYLNNSILTDNIG